MADGSMAPRLSTPLALPLPGLVAAAAAVLLAIALAVGGRTSFVAFVLLFALALGLTAVAAWRWPLATLFAASLTTLADPGITPRVLPRGFDPAPLGISEPLLLVAGLVVIWAAVRRGRLAPALNDPVLPLAGLFVVVACLSAVANAVPPLVAALGIVMTVDAIAIYLAVRMVPVDVRRAGAGIGAIVGVATIAALFGTAQVILDPELLGFGSFVGQFGEGVRITSFIGNPNMVAAVIGLAVPFALHGSRHLGSRRSRWFSMVALTVLVLGLLLTFSRGGWLAVGLGTTVAAVVLDWRSIPILVAAVVLAWLVTIVMPRSLLVGGERIEDEGAFLGTTFDRIAHLGTAGDLRAMFLRDGLRIVSDQPLLGVGPGRYGGAAATIIPSPVYEQYHAGLAGYRTVHNFWLHLLGEVGVIGTAVFLTMVLGLLIRFVVAAREASGTTFVILAGAATVVLVISLDSLTEMTFEGNMPILLAWLIFGTASLFAPVRPLFAGRR